MTTPNHRFNFRPYLAGTLIYLVIPICLVLGLWWKDPVAGNAITLFFIVVLLWGIGIGIDKAFVNLDNRLDNIEARLESIEDQTRFLQYK